MSPKEFADEMRRIAQEADDDPEVAHRKADNLMLEVLSELGYREGAEVFDNMPRWYA